MRRLFALLAVAACARPAHQPNLVAEVSVAPQATASPDEPVLLLGKAKPADEPAGGLERVKVTNEEPDAAWKPPKDRCPDGIGELVSVHVPLGQAMALAAGAAPVSALGRHPDVADLSYDPAKKTIHVTARKYGSVYLTVVRDGKCILYGVSTGY